MAIRLGTPASATCSCTATFAVMLPATCLAPLPSHLQSCSFDGIEDKVRELWEPLASYEPPSIEAPPPPPPPPAEDDQQEQAMTDAVPEESGLLADELLGLEEGEPAELAMREAPQPDAGAAAEAEVDPTAEQPSQVAPTVEVAAADSEMEDCLAEDSSGSGDGSMDSIEEEQASCEEQVSGEEQASEEGSEEDQPSGEEQGSEEEQPSGEEQGSEEQGSEAEDSQPALPPTQAVESASPGAATEPPLEKVGRLGRGRAGPPSASTLKLLCPLPPHPLTGSLSATLSTPCSRRRRARRAAWRRGCCPLTLSCPAVTWRRTRQSHLCKRPWPQRRQSRLCQSAWRAAPTGR